MKNTSRNGQFVNKYLLKDERYNQEMGLIPGRIAISGPLSVIKRHARLGPDRNSG